MKAAELKGRVPHLANPVLRAGMKANKALKGPLAQQLQGLKPRRTNRSVRPRDKSRGYSKKKNNLIKIQTMHLSVPFFIETKSMGGPSNGFRSFLIQHSDSLKGVFYFHTKASSTPFSIIGNRR